MWRQALFKNPLFWPGLGLAISGLAIEFLGNGLLGTFIALVGFIWMFVVALMDSKKQKQ